MQIESSAGTKVTVDPIFKAARASFRPIEAESAFRMASRSGSIAAATGAGIIYSFRYTGTGICAIQSVRMGLNVTTLFTKGNVAYRMFGVRNFSVADATGGTLQTYGYGNRLRAQMPPSQSLAYITTTALITAATGPVEDPQGIASVIFNLPAAITGQPMQNLFTYSSMYGSPLLLSLYEGFRIRQTALPAAGVGSVSVHVEWIEYPAISTTFY